MRVGHHPPPVPPFHRYLLESIDSIRLVRGAIFVRKLMPAADRLQALKELAPFVEQAKDALVWAHYSHKLRENGWPIAQVAAALRASVALDASRLVVFHRLSEALVLDDKKAEAAAVLKRAFPLCTTDQQCKTTEAMLDRLM